MRRSARPDVLVSGQMAFGDPTRGLLAQVRREAGMGPAPWPWWTPPGRPSVSGRAARGTTPS